jgi:hypothetical protein
MDNVGLAPGDRVTREDHVADEALVRPRGIGDVLRAVVDDSQQLVRAEMALARAEVDQKVERLVMALVWTFGGMMLAFAALVIVMLAGVDALSRVMPVWAGDLLIGIVVGVVGAIIAYGGVRMLSVARLAPTRTARNLQADAQMVKDHT